MQDWITARSARAFFFGACLWGLTATGWAQQAAPRIAVAGSTIDLGVVRAGQDVEAVFEIENHGEAPLEILEVDPSCDCTAIEFDDEIAVGGKGLVRARLMTAELSGPVTKGIVLTTNDPTSRKFVLTLKATVVTNIELLPQPVVYMRSQPDGSVIGRLLVRKQGGVEGVVRLSKLQSSREIFVARAIELKAARPRGGGIPAGSIGDWLIEVEFKSGMTQFGRVREKLRFDTGLAAQPSIEVPIESSFDPPVVFSAETLQLIRAADGRWRGSCFASLQKGRAPSSLQVERKPDALAVTLTAVGERLVRIDLEAGAPIGEAMVGFRVDKTQLSLPVRAVP